MPPDHPRYKKSVLDYWSRSGWRSNLRKDVSSRHPYGLTNIQYIGYMPEYDYNITTKISMPDDRVYREVSKLFPDFDYTKYRKVHPGHTEIRNSLRRMNTTEFKHSKCTTNGLAFALAYLMDKFSCYRFREWTWEEVYDNILPSSPGVWWKDLYKTKREGAKYIMHIAMSYYTMDPEVLSNLEPLFMYSPKGEILDSGKIKGERCRGIKAPPACVVCLETKYFGHIKSILEDMGEGLGLVMQYGNIQSIERKMRQCDVNITADIQGMDDSIHDEVANVVHKLFAFLLERIERPPGIPAMFAFLREHRSKLARLEVLRRWLAQSYMVCPNGEVYRKAWGNPSGKGLTSVEATLSMMVVCLATYHSCNQFVDKPLCNEELINEYDKLVKLHCGDDHQQGGQHTPINDLFFDQKVRTKIFGWYGMVIKPGTYIVRHKSTDDQLFLGFGVDDDGVLRFRDRDRALCALVHRSNTSDLSEVLNGVILLFPFDLDTQLKLQELARALNIMVPTSLRISLLWTDVNHSDL